MKRKASGITAAILLTPIILFVVFYSIMALYYCRVFPAGVYLNGHYCTGLSLQQLEKVTTESEIPYNLTIVSYQGTEIIQGSEFCFSRNYKEQILALKKQINPLLWGYYLFHPVTAVSEGTISYDKDMLEGIIKDSEIYQKAHQSRNPKVYIQMTNQGYVCVDETQHAIDTEELVNQVIKTVDAGKSELDLTDGRCDKKYQKSTQMNETIQLFDKINKAQSTKIIYEKDGQTLQPDKKEIAKWIAIDSEGNFILDDLGDLTISENNITEFVQKIANTYDSVGKDRLWEKSSGGTVSVNNGDYGFEVDKEAETEQLMSSVLYGIDQQREPFPVVRDEFIGDGKIGDTYIEVDMSNQMLYYYVNGSLYLKTDVVTGAVNRGRGTPQKVCYVYAKQKNRTLRGANYAAFVNYWMPVSGNIGLHDASWRKEFGGEIYKNSGSHGCINLPKEAAEKIYDQVEIGTPVIMYY